jgi:hypothetical protein
MLAKGQQRGSPQVQPWTVPRVKYSAMAKKLRPMKKAVSLAGLLCLSMNFALAQPKKLDVIGLTLGESDFKAVQQATENNSGYNWNEGVAGTFKIGGYFLTCTSKFIDGKLSKFNCSTKNAFYEGEEINTLTKSKRLVEVSNFEIHQTLFDGYVKKFGQPKEQGNEILRTKIGVPVKRHTALWIDAEGGILMISNVEDNLKEGSLLFVSAAQLKKEKEVINEINASRRF